MSIKKSHLNNKKKHKRKKEGEELGNAWPVNQKKKEKKKKKKKGPATTR